MRFTVRYVPARMGTYLVGQVDANQDLLPYQVSRSSHFLASASQVTELSLFNSRWSSLAIQVLLLIFRFAELSNGESMLHRFSYEIRRLNFSIFEQKLALAFTSSTLLAGFLYRCELSLIQSVRRPDIELIELSLMKRFLALSPASFQFEFGFSGIKRNKC